MSFLEDKLRECKATKNVQNRDEVLLVTLMLFHSQFNSCSTLNSCTWKHVLRKNLRLKWENCSPKFVFGRFAYFVITFFLLGSSSGVLNWKLSSCLGFENIYNYLRIKQNRRCSSWVSRYLSWVKLCRVAWKTVVHRHWWIGFDSV